jgi:dihydropteroate synthase
MSEKWLCGRFEFTFERPILMGIVNVTPDSFSDGGHHATTRQAIDHAQRLMTEGAQILDIGGESTRPGATPVSVEDELKRVLPVVHALRDTGVAISVDTCKSAVMRAALDAGADMLNDVTGFRDPASRQVASSHSSCGLCVMHMQGEPRTMQRAPRYENVVQDVKNYLLAQARLLEESGIDTRRICLDPGYGFGKTLEQNYVLIKNLDQITQAGYPVMFGVSRKSLIGTVTGQPVNQRLAGSIAAALAGVMRGAVIIRVHDVAETRDALNVWNAVEHGVSSQ